MTADLVRQAQGGDHAAFDSIIGAAYDGMIAIAYRILRDRTAAEDATQDAVVRCWRDLRGLREPDRFEAWLHRLLVNACRDLARRNRRRPTEVLGTGLETPAGGDDYRQLADHDELERAFLQLPGVVLEDLTAHGSAVEEWIIEASMATRPNQSVDHWYALALAV